MNPVPGVTDQLSASEIESLRREIDSFDPARRDTPASLIRARPWSSEKIITRSNTWGEASMIKRPVLREPVHER
jgi:hypothetical protein